MESSCSSTESIIPVTAQLIFLKINQIISHPYSKTFLLTNYNNKSLTLPKRLDVTWLLTPLSELIFSHVSCPRSAGLLGISQVYPAHCLFVALTVTLEHCSWGEVPYFIKVSDPVTLYQASLLWTSHLSRSCFYDTFSPRSYLTFSCYKNSLLES